jgi:hypothetical protein
MTKIKTLEEAVAHVFPETHPNYQSMVVRRFRQMYAVPEKEAIKAVLKGYSSPSAAMSARVIKRRDRLT